MRPDHAAGRGCAYAPMVELLGYLDANGFSNYIASGGSRDLMRSISEDMCHVPRERVIGNSSTFASASDDHGGTITHKLEADYLDNGPEKPARIWNRIGRRPLLAAGNANGDVPMLEFTHHADKPTLRLVVLHDDAEREFDYTTGPEQAARTSQGRRRDGGQRQERPNHRFLIRCGQRRTARPRNEERIRSAVLALRVRG